MKSPATAVKRAAERKPGELQAIASDAAKLAFVAVTLAALAGLFCATPLLSTPTLLAIVFTMLLKPPVAALERRGYSRTLSILVIFGGLGAAFAAIGYWGANEGAAQWASLRASAPGYFHAASDKLTGAESWLKSHYPVLAPLNIASSAIAWGTATGQAVATRAPGLVGSLLTWLLIVPPLTYVMLSEGPTLRRQLFRMIPNRYFETIFMVVYNISESLSDYLRAKLIEALLVGLMTTAGLAIFGVPYAAVLGAFAGVTNIVPYAGPLIGAAPGILLAIFDSAHFGGVLPLAIVYVAANVIDTIVIFPVVVAKLVNLHPLLLIAIVAVGQQWGGLVGMLVSIPIATALKVVATEVHAAIYRKAALPAVTDSEAESDPPAEDTQAA
jgi:putative permease